MLRISKRLEALERAADKEIFGNEFSIVVAIAYYLGGAKDESEFPYAYAKALGYQDLDELCEALADLLRQPSKSVDGPARAHRAQCKLLAKFGYDLRRTSPAALADARYRIVATLPEKWRAMIKSAHREECELEARSNQFFKEIMEVAEQCGVFAGPNGAKATEGNKSGDAAQRKPQKSAPSTRK
jgi:hypothetical protein